MTTPRSSDATGGPRGRRTRLRRAAPLAALAGAAAVFVAAVVYLTVDTDRRPSPDGARVACHAHVESELGQLVRFDPSPTVAADGDYVTVSGTFSRATGPGDGGEYHCAAHWVGSDDGGWSVGTSALADDPTAEPTPTVIARHRPSPTPTAEPPSASTP
ncbi:hypothetical protein INN71_01725 [Nocardioides sp. ChNu-153]|uniref:hypothetical protein n=1 Tax=unclassified Nocardioides TaxID=2615069 RepID=UPI002407251D|nr:MULTISPECIES: hypothetical protein [unclassified Nocardioides]MDF9714769.1 hypothetical protein [Nocardioides sp. ChNu-99]MDN7120105.1 hypothetical protein [Nocardioides sp. ChNu-153]